MRRIKRPRPPKAYAMFVSAVCLAVMLALAGGVTAGVSNSDCTDCHEDIGTAFMKTAHGIYLANTPNSEYSCESCHGPGEAHVEEADPALIINPAKTNAFSDQDMCLNCHTDHAFDEWAFSGHKNGDVSCADCHTVHGAPGQIVKKATPDLCYDCHSDVRAATYMPSHHPIAEGKMSCDNCHNPHGGKPEFVMAVDDRDLCFSCHADKEGPFVYEHAPVNEDCMLCHSPHGSVANNLLKQSEPTLCLNCHSMHFHATVVSVDGDFTDPLAPERASSSTPDGWKKGMLTRCTQCHTMIHGSDNPSQTISTGGNALTR